MAKRNRYRPILRHGLSGTPEYRVWQTMRHRCLESTSPAWEAYGGRGITIFEGWIEDPAAFIAHIGPRPSPNHEIDRKDNNKGYEPGNVRWVSRVGNSRNRRSNRWIEFRGETKTLSSWCAEVGFPVDTVSYRLRKGWTVEAAFTTPVNPKGPNGTKAKKAVEIAERVKRGRHRDNEGKFTFDGDLRRLCRCDHPLGEHATAAPHECLSRVGRGSCSCDSYSPARPGKQFPPPIPMVRPIPPKD